MDIERLETIVKTRRGKTYLVRRLVETSGSTYAEASRTINTVWNDKTLSDQELFERLNKILDVDDVTISKEQFLQMIEKAISSAEDYYMDPLTAVKLLCENVEKQGGLRGLAKRLNKFVNSI